METPQPSIEFEWTDELLAHFESAPLEEKSTLKVPEAEFHAFFNAQRTQIEMRACAALKQFLQKNSNIPEEHLAETPFSLEYIEIVDLYPVRFHAIFEIQGNEEHPHIDRMGIWVATFQTDYLIGLRHYYG